MQLTDYQIEKQIRLMLDKFKQSDLSQKKDRHCIAEVIANRLKKYFKKDNE